MTVHCIPEIFEDSVDDLADCFCNRMRDIRKSPAETQKAKDGFRLLLDVQRTKFSSQPEREAELRKTERAIAYLAANLEDANPPYLEPALKDLAYDRVDGDDVVDRAISMKVGVYDPFAHYIF